MIELRNALRASLLRDLFHCRALFRWIIAKDLSKTTKDIVRPGAAASILKGVKSGKETYHQLFKKLCRYAEHCAKVLFVLFFFRSLRRRATVSI